MLNLSGHSYEFGPFRLHLRERLLLRGAEPVALTPKAFDVLAVLVQHHGRLVTKDELLAQAWPDAIVTESSLSQKIYQLRKLLEEDSEPETYIQTVPRHGYRFVADVRNVQSVSAVEIHQNILLPAPLPSPPIRQPQPTIIRFTAARASLIAVLLFLVIAGGVWGWRRDQTNRIARAPQKIAILPFKQLGDDANVNLGLGIADSLINKLSRLSATNQIKVLPTNAVFQFNDKNADRAAVGRLLGVDGVVDGTIQRLGDRVRVTAQLTNLSDNRVVWSGQFDTKLSDVFELQDAISIQLAESLKPQLTQSEQQILTKRETKNSEAYEAYATAMYFRQLRSKEGIIKAVQYFRKAIEIDPDYAKAYAGLSDCYMLSFQYEYKIVPDEEASRLQTEAAAKSLALDPNLAEAHLANAPVAASNAEANSEYQQALQLDPVSSIAHQRYGVFLFMTLQLDQAVQHMRIAQELDPASSAMNATLGQMLFMQRDYASAKKYSERALELNPNREAARVVLAGIYDATGKYDQAIDEYRRVADQYSPIALAGIAHAQAMAGSTEKAKEILNEFAKDKTPSPEETYDLAVIYAALGENAKAIRALQSVKLSRKLVAFLTYDPQLDVLRADPQFTNFLHSRQLDDQFARSND